MTLETGVKELAEAVGADVKALDTGKVNSTDPRLTDSREWSEATVTQAEAEAGTASSRRAWTAQRVRQAISAWWNSVTSSLGRNLIAASNESAARNVLQLGTAATKGVATNAQALTGTAGVLPDAAGVHAAFKQFGYGGQNPGDLALNCNDLPVGSRKSWDGVTESTAVSLNLPALGGSSSAPRSWHVECFGRGSSRLVQEATEVYGVGTIKGRTFTRVKHDANWSPWAEVLRTGAYGLGEQSIAGQPATQLGWNALFGMNLVLINSSGPFSSLLGISQNTAHIINNDGNNVILNIELYHSGNTLNIGTTPASARAALQLTGEWVDLRPYLQPPFYWDPAREGQNPHPRIRKLFGGRVELDGVVSWNETPAAPQNGIAFRVPPEFRPVHTSAGVSFVDSTPIYFGTGQWLVSGEVEYSSGLHGEVMLILGNPPSPSQGVFGLNGVGWFLD